MLKNSFFKTIPFLFFVILFNSCDKEFSVVGNDIIKDNSFDIVKGEYPVVAYNQKIGSVQSNNLVTNAFGVYSNPSFGTTTATFVTQLAMPTESINPIFDKTAKIKSVVLSIPYFVDAKQTVLKDDGSSTYVLDSIYGTKEAKMKLSVYESGYYLRNLDPEDQLSQYQKYYNDQYSDFFSNKLGVPLNDSINKSENELFFFDPKEHIDSTKVNGIYVKSRTAPAMRLTLNKLFFQNKILNAPAGSLVNNDVFKDYFRGLFFNIETIGANPGELAMINFRAGTITITYTEKVDSKDVQKTFVLNLIGNTVSLLNQSNTNADYTDATKPASDIDKTEGVSDLYLKGGEGSLSILNLFEPTDNHGLELDEPSNGVSDQLDDMRKNKYLINQADLTIYLNTAKMGSSYLPQRIYLYDYTNNTILADYNETSVVSSNTKYNKYIFGGILSKDKNGAYYYKFRITKHIRDLVNSTDFDNVKLGLVVTEDINKSAFYALKDKAGIPLYIPLASVMNPLGAIVFGNNILSNNENYAKRMKFEIYYTKAN